MSTVPVTTPCPAPRFDGAVSVLCGKPIVWRWISGRWTARPPREVGERGLDEAFANFGAAADTAAGAMNAAFDALDLVGDDEAAAILADLEG